MSPEATIRLVLHAPGADLGRIDLSDSAFKGATSAEQPPQRTAWIVPSRHTVEQIRRRLLARPAASVLHPEIRSVRQAATALLGQADVVARPLTPPQNYWLVRQLLDDAIQRRRLSHLVRIENRDRQTELVVRTFADLSQSLPPGEIRRAERLARKPTAASGDLGQELLSLYGMYRQELTRHQLMDDYSRFALAADLARGGQLGPFVQSQQVVVAGFDELRRMQREFLLSLGKWRRLVVLLPWPVHLAPPELPKLKAPSALEDGPAEDRLAADHGNRQGERGPASPWQSVRQSISQLAAGAAELEIVRLPHQAPSAALHSKGPNDGAAAGSDNPPNTAELRVSQWLFRDPRDAPAMTASQGDRFRVVPARGAVDEWRQIAHRVKGLLQEGVAPGQIVVASRQLAGIADRAGQAMAEFGVPVSIDQAPLLGEAPLQRTLLTLLRLASNDWRRAELLALITTPALAWMDKPAAGESPAKVGAECRQAGFAGPRAATEWMVRELQLVGGRQAWLNQLKLHASSEATNEAAPSDDHQPAAQTPRRNRMGVAARFAHARLEALDEALTGPIDAWRQPTTPLGAWDQLREILTALHYRAATDTRLVELDQAALEALEEGFSSLERLAEWQGKPAPHMNLELVTTQLATWSRTTPLELPRNEEGCVRLLSIDTARYERPDYLFLTGMTDGALPASPSASPIKLFPQSVEEHYSREMLLLFDLIHAPRKQVAFSYSSMDDAGQPISPSSYLAEIERLLAPHSLREAPAEPAELALRSPCGWRQQAVRQLGEGKHKPLATLAQANSFRSAPLLAGLEVSLDRATGDAFGAAEGMIVSDAAQAELARRFGSQHLWSPTKLETYAKCPFQFFLKEVLGIAEPAESDLQDNFRRRGTLLHNAMVKLHAQLSETGSVLQTLQELDDNEFAAAFRDAVEHAKQAMRFTPQESVLGEIESRQANNWGEGYRDQLQKYSQADTALGGQMQPAYFEVRFGGTPHENEPFSELSLDDPFVLDLGDEEIRLIGQVDRIDLGELSGQKVFNVVDYKTGKKVTAKLSDLREGRQLQLYLYTLATEQHLLAESGARAWRMGYWAIRGAGFAPPAMNKQKLAATELVEDSLQTTDMWQEYGEAVRVRLQHIVRGVRTGEFPMFNSDDKCGEQCEFRTTCRVNQTRSLDKLPPVESSEADEAP